MRHLFDLWGHEWNSSVTIAHIRSYDDIYFHLDNRRADGSFHQFEDEGQTWGNAPFGDAPPDYGSLTLGDNGFEHRNTYPLWSPTQPCTDHRGRGGTLDTNF